MHTCRLRLKIDRAQILRLVIAGLLTGSSAIICADDLSVQLRSAVSRIEPYVVRVQLIGTAAAVEQGAVTSATTTGLCLSNDGRIITSAFAFEETPQAVLVHSTTGQRQTAKIVATDFVRKLVLLDADGDEWAALPEELIASDVAVGEWSVGLGRFYQPQASNVSVGIISATGRVNGMAIQSDVKVSPVNYGGPLINLAGQVTGVMVPLSPRSDEGVTAGVEWYDSGIGFAIPIADVLKVADALQAGNDRLQGRLGIYLKEANPFSTKLTIDRTEPGGPAAKAGLLPGDQLLKVNDRPLDRPPQLQAVIGSSYAGDTLNLEYRRKDTVQSTLITLVDKIPLAGRGYLGLLPIPPAPAAKPDAAREFINRALRGAAPGETPALDEVAPRDTSADEPDSKFDAEVISHSAAASAGLTGRIQIIAVNEQKVSSRTDVLREILPLPPGVQVTLTFQNSEQETNSDAPQSVTLTTSHSPFEPADAGAVNSESSTTAGTSASPAPLHLPVIDRLLLHRVFGAAGEPVSPGDDPAPEFSVARREVSVGEAGRCILVTPAGQTHLAPGLAVILPSRDVSEESLLEQWKPVMHSHGLAIAIPVNAENTQLTREDLMLVTAAIKSAVSEVQADPGRVMIVADDLTQDVARDLLFSRRSGIRGVALTSGRLTGADAMDLAILQRTVLQISQQEDRVNTALTAKSINDLISAGVRVFVHPETGAPDSRDAIQAIADWSIAIRAI